MKTPQISYLLIQSLATLATVDNAVYAAGLVPPKIDVHSHVYPDFYKNALLASGYTSPDGSTMSPVWNVSTHLAFMDANNIQKSYLSCSSPGTMLLPNDTTAGIALTRHFNNYTSSLKRQYPSKFGFFAILPLPEIDASLDEIDRATDELDADGFVLLSNHLGLYHGDPKLAPVYSKLNARKRMIFIHPTNPCLQTTPIDVSGNTRLSYTVPLNNVYSVAILDFLYDTTRTVMDLVLTGTAAKYRNLSWIVPHCGSALPSLLDRFLQITSHLGHSNPDSTGRLLVPYSLQNVTALLRQQFWFDLAGFPLQNQIHNMLRLVGPNRFLYGSDFPFTSASIATELASDMNDTLAKIFDVAQIKSIFHDNAAQLAGI